MQRLQLASDRRAWMGNATGDLGRLSIGVGGDVEPRFPAAGAGCCGARTGSPGRSMPGTIPAMSQLDRLISMTAINVLAGSRAMRDRLKSFSVCMGSSIGSQRTMDAISTPPPHSIFHHGIRRPMVDRSKRTCELTSSIVPRGTSFHHLVELEFPPIAFDL